MAQHGCVNGCGRTVKEEGTLCSTCDAEAQARARNKHRQQVTQNVKQKYKDLGNSSTTEREGTFHDGDGENNQQ